MGIKELNPLLSFTPKKRRPGQPPKGNQASVTSASTPTRARPVRQSAQNPERYGEQVDQIALDDRRKDVIVRDPLDNTAEWQVRCLETRLTRTELCSYLGFLNTTQLHNWEINDKKRWNYLQTWAQQPHIWDFGFVTILRMVCPLEYDTEARQILQWVERRVRWQSYQSEGAKSLIRRWKESRQTDFVITPELLEVITMCVWLIRHNQQHFPDSIYEDGFWYSPEDANRAYWYLWNLRYCMESIEEQSIQSRKTITFGRDMRQYSWHNSDTKAGKEKKKKPTKSTQVNPRSRGSMQVQTPDAESTAPDSPILFSSKKRRSAVSSSVSVTPTQSTGKAALKVPSLAERMVDKPLASESRPTMDEIRSVELREHSESHVPVKKLRASQSITPTEVPHAAEDPPTTGNTPTPQHRPLIQASASNGGPQNVTETDPAVRYGINPPYTSISPVHREYPLAEISPFSQDQPPANPLPSPLGSRLTLSYPSSEDRMENQLLGLKAWVSSATDDAPIIFQLFEDAQDCIKSKDVEKFDQLRADIRLMVWARDVPGWPNEPLSEITQGMLAALCQLQGWIYNHEKAIDGADLDKNDEIQGLMDSALKACYKEDMGTFEGCRVHVMGYLTDLMAE